VVIGTGTIVAVFGHSRQDSIAATRAAGSKYGF
jgi:hypothetical protein